MSLMALDIILSSVCNALTIGLICTISFSSLVSLMGLDLVLLITYLFTGLGLFLINHTLAIHNPINPNTDDIDIAIAIPASVFFSSLNSGLLFGTIAESYL